MKILLTGAAGQLGQPVNGGAPRAFAEALAETGGRLLQVSADFCVQRPAGQPLPA